MQEKYKKRIHESALKAENNNELGLKVRFRKKIGSKLELLKEEQRVRYAET